MGITTENLKVGMEVKNYKTLCELMGIPEESNKTGNSRLSVWRDIDCYIDYEKDGSKIFISEIYSKPLPKKDRRLEGLHSKYINIILSAYLIRQSQNIDSDDCTISSPKSQWYKILGLCNNKYKTKDRKVIQTILSEGPHIITKSKLNEFYMKKDDRLGRYFFSTLNQMKDRRLLSYKEKIILHGSDVNDVLGYYRTANENEEKIIRNAEREILVQMKLKSMFQMRAGNLSDVFYSKVIDELRNKESHLYISEDIEYYYKTIEINYSKKLVTEGFDMLIKEYEMDSIELVADALRQNNLNTVSGFLQANLAIYPPVKVGKRLDTHQKCFDIENYLIDQLLKLDTVDNLQLFVERQNFS